MFKIKKNKQHIVLDKGIHCKTSDRVPAVGRSTNSWRVLALEFSLHGQRVRQHGRSLVFDKRTHLKPSARVPAVSDEQPASGFGVVLRVRAS